MSNEPLSDSLMPDPEVWPECSDCHTAYVMRRALSFTKGRVWVWQQDCKHGRKGSPQPDAVIARREDAAV
jgi:hypothetical protein